jgi:hypothetical protein
MEETDKAARYFIDHEGARDQRRSISALIAGRRCYACRQADTEEPVPTSDPQVYIAQIAKQCADTSDYLLPDTPIKEAIFRVILAGGNEPMTAEQVSETLLSRWAMSAYPRDLSPTVIGRILDHSQSYCVVVLPEPSPKEGSDEEDRPSAEQDDSVTEAVADSPNEG